jgi:ATP phosphoribosyltransferase
LAEHRGTAETESEEDDYDDDIIVLEQDLGFGYCRLAVAVPETWIDVSSCADLWHLAGYYLTHKNRGLRIATKYPTLTGQFLRQHGITHCRIFSPHGALEAAPLTDSADLIVDLTETGTTLRENHLKLLDDGVLLRSQACLIGNARLLRENEEALRLASMLLELIEARMQARNRSMLTAHMQARTTEEMQQIFARMNQRLFSLVSSLEIQTSQNEGQNSTNPYRYTISGVTNVNGSTAEFLEIVTVLRNAGAVHINVTPLTYRFAEESASVGTLKKRLKRKH